MDFISTIKLCFYVNSSNKINAYTLVSLITKWSRAGSHPAANNPLTGNPE